MGSGEEAPDQLLAHPANWRLHPKAQQEALSAVLSEVGWVQHVVVNRRTGHVLDGHLRAELAISRDEPSVPVVYVDLSEEEETIVLATFDPLSAMAVADREKLAELIERARAAASRPDVQALLQQLAKTGRANGAAAGAQGAAAIDPGDELRQRWGVEPGQLWEIPSRSVGQWHHRLLCGDGTDPNALARLIDGRAVDALLADPPYGRSLLAERGQLGSHSSRAGVPGRVYEPVAGDDQPFDPAPWLNYRVVVLWGANWYASRLPDAGCWLIWDKRDGTASNDMADAELAWTNLPGPTRLFSHRWMGMIRDSEQGQPRYHPNQKPVALLQWVIEQCRLVHGARLLDPYLGSGTTMLAAERAGCVAYGCEIEPRYVAVALERLKGLGLEPRKVEGP